MENKQNKQQKNKNKKSPDTFMDKLTDYRMLLSQSTKQKDSSTLLQKDRNTNKFSNLNLGANTSRDVFAFSGLIGGGKLGEALQQKVLIRQKKFQQQIEKLQTQTNIIEGYFQSKVNSKQEALKDQFLDLEYFQKQQSCIMKDLVTQNKSLQIQFPKQTFPKIENSKQRHNNFVAKSLKDMELLNQYSQSISQSFQSQIKNREKQYPEVIQFLSEHFLQIESLITDLKESSSSQLSGLQWKLQDLRLDSKQILQNQSRERKHSHNLAYSVLDKLIQRVGCFVSEN